MLIFDVFFQLIISIPCHSSPLHTFTHWPTFFQIFSNSTFTICNYLRCKVYFNIFLVISNKINSIVQLLFSTLFLLQYISFILMYFLYSFDVSDNTQCNNNGRSLLLRAQLLLDEGNSPGTICRHNEGSEAQDQRRCYIPSNRLLL